MRVPGRLTDTNLLRVFLCEFVTGGGMQGNPLPQSLSREGRMMRDALARDLAELDGVDLTTVHEARFAPVPFGASRRIETDEDPWRVWSEMAGGADLVWTIAPETDGLLLRLNGVCRAAGARVMGPDDDAIRIASFKSLTAERLVSAGVSTPATWSPDALPQAAIGPFVSKPDDGAGCEATLFWSERPPEGAVPRGHVVQPFVAGAAASVTMLVEDGAATILSANRQHVSVDDGAFRFDGVTVGAYARDDPSLVRLAGAVRRALPGLDGVFGIDLVRAAEGDVVIEINPRLTTSYVGLREALGINPLTLLPAFRGLGTARPTTRHRPVEVRL